MEILLSGMQVFELKQGPGLVVEIYVETLACYLVGNLSDHNKETMSLLLCGETA